MRSYRDIRRTVIDHGFVQQHSLHVGFDDGRTADLPACLVVAVADGLIVRIDEYLDGAAVDATFGTFLVVGGRQWSVLIAQLTDTHVVDPDADGHRAGRGVRRQQRAGWRRRSPV